MTLISAHLYPFCLAVLLGGCALLSSPEPVARPAQPEFASFALNGRISIIHEEKRHSAGLRWTHQAQTDEILLLGPLGLAGAAAANLAGAAVSYVAALVLLSRVLPEGAGERARSAALSVGLTVPLLGLAMLLFTVLSGPLSLALRLILDPAALVAVFATRLVNGYDVHKLSSVPVNAAGPRRADPISARGSNLFSTMTRSNGYVIVPENQEGLAEGEMVAVNMFEDLKVGEGDV